MTRQESASWTYEALAQFTDIIWLAIGKCELTLAESYDDLLPYVNYDEPTA